MTRHPIYSDMEPEDLRHFLVQEARADSAPPEARDRAVRRVGMPMGAIGAGLIASSAAHGAAISPHLAALAPVAVVLKWSTVGALSAVVTLGAVEAVKSTGTVPTESRTSTFSAVQKPISGAPASEAMPNAPPTDEKSGPIEFGPIEENGGQKQDRAPLASPAEDTPPYASNMTVSPAIVRHETVSAKPASSDYAVGPPPAPPPSVTPVKPSSRGDLPGELRTLEEARRALAAKALPHAIEALARYEREFPAGSMQMEAMALRVEALGESNRHEEALALAREFLTKYPQSPLVVRVQSLVSGWARRPRNW